MIAGSEPVITDVMPPNNDRSMTLNCPTCDLALRQRSTDGVTVDYCASCNGTWYDPTELSSLLRATTTLESVDQNSAEPPCTITCPQCDNEISATIYAHDSGIPVLKCSRCSGLWLVAGQLEKLSEYRNGRHRTDKLGEALAESFARSNALNRIADLIQSRLLSIIFAVVILAVAVYSGDDIPGILSLFAFLILPMACIWFSDAMGNTTGIRIGWARPTITQSTPGIAVAIGGWILLFTVFGMMIYNMVSR